MIVDEGIASGRRLSFGQERLWWLQQINPDDVGYNLFLALEFTPDVAEPALLCALGDLVARHEILRSAFIADVSGTPHQVVVDNVRMPLTWLDRTPEEDPLAVAREAIAQPFGLADGAPIRGIVVRCDDQPDVVYLVFHHILVDARSLDILAGELAVLYDAHRTGQPVTLPPSPAQFGDFVAEQRRPSRAARLAADVDYWRTELDGVERLRLPTDYPRPQSSDHPGDRVGLTLSPEETSALQRFALRHRCAVPSVVAAAFQLLLSVQAGQPDVTIGTAFAGRGDAALSDVVGFFVNTCALRTDVASAASGRALVRLAHAKLAAAHAHQDAPFDQVVAATRFARDVDRNPLFDVVYVHHTASTDDVVIGVDGIRRLPSPDVAVRFDLELTTVVVDGCLNGALAYRTDLFQRATIALFADRLAHVIRLIMSDPDSPIEELDVLLPGERRRLLTEWNNTDHPVPPTTLPALFEAQAARTPDAVALEFEGTEWSYEALDSAANRLARLLIYRGVGPEDVVAVALPRSLHLVIALLGVMKAGAAYLPIDITSPPTRVALIVHDAKPRWGITIGQILPTLPELAWVAIDDGDIAARIDRGDGARVADADRVAQLRPEHLAYVIFTSGSTGRPKGVAVSHVGLASMAVTHAEQLEMSPQSRVLQHASASFDAAVWELIQALSSGATLVLPAPELVLAGQQLADVLLTSGITHALLTPTALRSLPVEPAVAVLRTLVVGGEACQPDLVDRWSSGRRMLNAYGPTETTVCATVSTPLSAGTGAPIGRPVRNTRIYVLDGRLRLVPTGVSGEVYVAGAGLARGYLGQASLTAERFIANPYGPPGSRMYRTGDLARWRSDGELEYVGRVDEQVKVRGFRIEPREIEAVLDQLPSVAGVAVVVRDDDRGDRRLVAYVVPTTRDAVAPAELRVHASQWLPGYLVPSTFVLLDELPLTSSGKLDRQALPEPTYAISGSRRPPRSPQEEILCEIFGEVLGVASPGIDDGFFDLGGHSLLATRLTSRIRKMLGVEVPMRAVFEAPTVAQLAQRLNADRAVRPPLLPLARPLRPPLSSAQRRLWFLSRLEEAAAYNVASALRMRGTLDVDALHAALTDVMDRHEALRTVFPEADGEPWQDVRPARTPASFTVVQSTEAEVRRELATAAEQVFDLAADLPLRAWLFVLGPNDHVLLLVVHHIAFDGWSAVPFWRDLAEAYDARLAGREPDWSPLPVQYVDYTLWQRGIAGDSSDPGSLASQQLKHWTSILADAPLQTALPFDRPRSTAARDADAELAFDLPPSLHAGLRAVARDHQVTLFMVLQAALAVVLSRLGAGPDILLGTPIAGRTDDALDDLVGFFINTLVLRTDVSGDPTFGEVLGRVRTADLAAYANQDLPFESVVDALKPPRVLGANPLFQVSLALENAGEASPYFADLSTESVVVNAGRAKFDLAVVVSEPPGAAAAGSPLAGRVEYRTDLFDEATIRGMIARLIQLLETVTADPTVPISHIDLLTPAEHELFAHRWGATDVGASDLTVPELFRIQVQRTPDDPAVSCGETTLTYRELDARATRLASDLAARSVRLESAVAVAMERSVDLVVAFVAIMKAGGHYIPLPAGLPAARVSVVLGHSGASVMLVDPPSRTRELLECAAACGIEMMDPADAGDGGHVVGDVRWAEPARHPDNLAYGMYTSGSTGVPKGVAITDRDVAVLAADRCFGIGPGDRVLFHAPHAFDASVYELWVPLLNGGEVVVAPPGELDLVTIKELISAHKVTAVWVTAGLFRIMAEECSEAFAGVREVLTGGDVVSPSAARRLLDRVPGVRVRHLYGPTETTVFVTQHLVRSGEEPGSWVPLGRPLDGTRLYVLDDRLRLVPPGVDGEFYIGGAGLARGYINRPGLTAERFVADPFGPAGSLMYRTGDLVRWTTDGQLRYIGRRDAQMKINGFRVELGEIESVLAGRPEVAQVAVLARADRLGTKRLLAYVVPAAGSEIDAAELIRYVGESLPSYMTPAAIIPIDSLPLTSNAKVDWRALLELEPAASGSSRGPRTLREQILCELFAEVLDLPQVGVDDAFFDLGGHSLLAMRLVSRIRTELQVDASIRTLFEAPTVAALARTLDAGPADAFAMLVPLRIAGDGVPVFFVHPIGGLSWCYARFLPYIARRHPVYGLQASGYLGQAERPGTLDDVIAEYTTRIRQTHPHGPYALAGWSFGGLMAHEIAVELERRGGSVPVVFILDAAPARRDDRTDVAPLPEHVRRAIDVSVQGAAGGMTEALTPPTLADLTALAEHCVRLTAGYDSTVFTGRVVSIEASGPAGARDASRAPWSDYARGGVDRHIVECTHAEMMDPEVVSQTGPILAETIRRRLGTHVPEGRAYRRMGGDESA